MPLTIQLCRQLTAPQSFSNRIALPCLGAGSVTPDVRVHHNINNKKVSLILTLPPVPSYLMVNKNTASQEAKLLIQAQFKIFPLQSFPVFHLLSCRCYCWFIYLCVCCFYSVFGCFLFWLYGGVFPHFSPFTSCAIQRSRFLLVIWSTALQKQLSSSNKKGMEGV